MGATRLTNDLFAASMKQHKRTTRLTSRTACWWALLGVMLLLDCAPARSVGTVRPELTSSTPSAATPTVRLVREFVVVWRNAHRQAAVRSSPISAQARVRGTPVDMLKSVRMACLNGIDWVGGGYYNSLFPEVLREHMYAHRVTRRSDAGYCPDWSGTALAQPARPVAAQEGLFPGPTRLALASRRAALLTALEAASQTTPTDSVAVGQRVRFALDGGDTERARGAAAACAFGVPYCLRLAGLVAASSGQGARADSLFQAAWRAAAAAGVCDVSAERQLAARGTVREAEWEADRTPPPQGCAARLRWREQFWWASQPLWSEAYNVRRLEHERRQIEMALRTQVASDELLDWSADNRAPAAELVNRYGWPDRLIVADSGTEWSSRMGANPGADLPARPTGAAEYSRRRSATIPAATVLADPIGADPRDWLTARANRGHPLLETWPYEHMWLAQVLVPVPTWQWGRLLRAGQTVLCLAMPAPPPNVAGGRAHLLFSPGPADIRALPDGVRDGTLLRFLAPLPDTAGVVSVEVTGETESEGPMAWRLRGGMRPLAGVRASWGDTVRLSDVLLVEATEAVARDTADEYAVANHLLPTTTLAAGTTRVGLVWEVYGLRPSAGVSYRLTVTGERPGGLRQLFSDLVSRSSGEGPTRILSWDRTGAPPSAVLRETLQLGGLTAGKYTLALEARWGAGDADHIRSALTTIEIK